MTKQRPEAVHAGIVRVHGTLTAEGAEKLADVLRQAQRPERGELLTPLPRRLRLRLAIEHTVDSAAIRLVEYKHFTAAKWLWRAFGMWSS